MLLIAIGGAVMCMKARAAVPAAVFSVLAFVFFISTPMGSGLPGALATFFSAVDSATTPALTHDSDTTASTPAGVRR